MTATGAAAQADNNRLAGNDRAQIDPCCANGSGNCNEQHRVGVSTQKGHEFKRSVAGHKTDRAHLRR